MRNGELRRVSPWNSILHTIIKLPVTFTLVHAESVNNFFHLTDTDRNLILRRSVTKEHFMDQKQIKVIIFTYITATLHCSHIRTVSLFFFSSFYFIDSIFNYRICQLLCVYHFPQLTIAVGGLTENINYDENCTTYNQHNTKHHSEHNNPLFAHIKYESWLPAFSERKKKKKEDKKEKKKNTQKVNVNTPLFLNGTVQKELQSLGTDCFD